MKPWTCPVCQIQMQMPHRSSHLSGKRHAKAAQLRQEEADNSQNSQSEPRGLVTESNSISTDCGSPAANISEPSKYTKDTASAASALLEGECTMCGCYIESSSIQAHLTGMEHVGRLLEIINITCQALEPPHASSSGIQSQTYNHGLGIWETLDYQEALHRIKTFGTYSSNPYLVNTEISKSSIAVVDPLKPSNPPKKNQKSKMEPHLWTCPDCRTTVAIQRKAMHTCPNLHEPVPSRSSLDAFFLSFSGYKYDPSKSPAESFGALRECLPRCNDWDGSSPSTWKEYREEVFARYQTALTREFNLWFGTQDDIQSWHSLCQAVKLRSLPSTCAKCQQAVRSIHVNIVDLIEWARKGEVKEVQIFESVKELSKYSYDSNKIYRKDQLEQGVVLRHLLREIEKEKPKFCIQ